MEVKGLLEPSTGITLSLHDENVVDATLVLEEHR